MGADVGTRRPDARNGRSAPPDAAGTAGAPASAAVPISWHGASVRAGTSSWADRGLVRDGGFYPAKNLTATARLAYYASRLPVAEIATTFRFPPTPELCQQWARRTPDGFVFDVRAWSLLCGAPTLPDSLYADLRDEVAVSKRDQRRLYPTHLGPEALEECWRRFAHALGPLERAGRLGVVILRYPSWFSPRPEAWGHLAAARARLGGMAVSVELANPRWFEGSQCHDTLEWLEDHGLGLVCVDGPPDDERPGSGLVAATSGTALVRFPGRLDDGEHRWTWPYRYQADQLVSWVPKVAELASSADEVHLVFDNCWRSDAVDNAGELAALVAGAAAHAMPAVEPRPVGLHP